MWRVRFSGPAFVLESKLKGDCNVSRCRSNRTHWPRRRDLSALRSEGRPTRALARRTSDARRTENLRNMGVELIEGDLKDSRVLETCVPRCANCHFDRVDLGVAAAEHIEQVRVRGHIDEVSVPATVDLFDRIVRLPRHQDRRGRNDSSHIAARRFQGLWILSDRLR